MDIKIANLERSADGIDSMGHNALNAKDAFEEILDRMIVGEQALWSKQGGGGRNKWTPNKTGTPTLMRTGKLFRSLTQKGASGQIKMTKSGELEFGSSVFYGVFAQKGVKDTERNRTIPRRRILNVGAKTKREIREILTDFVTRDVEG